LDILHVLTQSFQPKQLKTMTITDVISICHMFSWRVFEIGLKAQYHMHKETRLLAIYKVQTVSMILCHFHCYIS